MYCEQAWDPADGPVPRKSRDGCPFFAVARVGTPDRGFADGIDLCEFHLEKRRTGGGPLSIQREYEPPRHSRAGIPTRHW